MMNYKEMKSPLAKARNLGSSGNGLHHWWHQRFTSILMIPLLIWFIYFLYSVSGKNLVIVSETLQKPINFGLMILFLITAFYHASLGMKVVIEDYISNIRIRNSIIILLQIFTIVTLLFGIVALLFLGKL